MKKILIRKLEIGNYESKTWWYKSDDGVWIDNSFHVIVRDVNNNIVREIDQRQKTPEKAMPPVCVEQPVGSITNEPILIDIDNVFWKFKKSVDRRITVWLSFNPNNGKWKIIDAVTGDIIGCSVSIPLFSKDDEGFSWSGPEDAMDGWAVPRLNADAWFHRWMVGGTTTIGLATVAQITANVGDPATNLYYARAHGGSSSATAGDGTLYASDITTAMASRDPMWFAFIGHCGGMDNTGVGSFSYALRKGTTVDTWTVGLTNWASCPSGEDGFPWQNEMFAHIHSGKTFKDAFDLATATYSGLSGYVAYVGDPTIGIITRKIQIKRGVEADRTNITPAEAEPIWTTDLKKLWIGDGVTAGGIGVGGGGGGGACVIVAASNTPTKLKNRADYVCNGTDDHLTIEDAFNDALTVLLCPSSTYYFGLEGASPPVNFNSLNMETNQRLIGAGPSTKITIPNLNNSYDYRFIDTLNSAHDIEIADIHFDGNNSVNTIGTQSGIELVGCDHVDIHHCIFQHCGDVTRASCMGIVDDATYLPSYCWIHHNRFTDIVDGINLNNASNHILINNNIIDDTSRDYGMNLGITDSIISNNIIKNCGSHGIHLYGEDGTDAERVTIHDNIIENCNTRNISKDGISISGSCDQILIHHNTIRKGTYQRYGLHLQVAFGADFRIYDNNLFDSGVTGNLYIIGTTTHGEVARNYGYNPVGGSAISVGTSPFTHTAGWSPETIYIRGGTVSLIVIGGRTLFVDTGHSIELPSLTSIVVTYSSVPTMEKYVH